MIVFLRVQREGGICSSCPHTPSAVLTCAGWTQNRHQSLWCLWATGGWPGFRVALQNLETSKGWGRGLFLTFSGFRGAVLSQAQARTIRVNACCCFLEEGTQWSTAEVRRWERLVWLPARARSSPPPAPGKFTAWGFSTLVWCMDMESYD